MDKDEWLVVGGDIMPKYNRHFEVSDGILYEMWSDRNMTKETGYEIGRIDELPYDSNYAATIDGCIGCNNPNYPSCKASCNYCDE